MPSAAAQAWSHDRRARVRYAPLLSCVLVLGACSVYTDNLVDAEALGSEVGGSKGSGGSALSSSGSSGKLGGSSGGKPGSGTGGAGAAASAGASGNDEPGSAGDAGVEGEGGADGGAGDGGAGTGNEAGGGGTGGSAGGSGAGGTPATQPGDLVDGFEDADLTLEQTSGRGGVWYLFDDETVGKAGPSPLAPSTLLDAPAALGSYAMHITATGFTGWGSGLGVDFRAGKKVYDGSKHSGIRFWARVGTGKNTRHRLQLADGTTDKLGGKCDPALDAVEGEKCEDHFGINQTFTTTWTQYVVPFSSLSQIGWGHAAAALDKSTLYGLQITAKAKLEVDLWLDEIEFY